ncbi:unnamed protein product, partial [Pelagomonas calceolata]
ALQEQVDRRRKMPRSQPSPGGAFPPEPPLSPSVSPASADRGRKKSGSGHRRRGSWSLERPRAHSFDEAEGRALGEDSDSDLNTLPTPARKQRRSTGRVRRFLRHEANVVKGGYKATKRNVGRFGRFLTKPMRPGRGRDEGDKAAREIPATPRAPCPADLAGPALRAAMRAVCAAALVVAAAAAAVATAPAPRAADAIIMLAALVSLFAACDASMKAADRLETTYKAHQEEDDEDDVIKEAPLTLVKEGTSDESGTWAPGRGADFAVRSSTYLENGVKKPSCEPLYTVGVAGFAMSAGAVNDGSRAYPEVLEKLRGEDADRDVFTDASSPLPKYVMITMNSPLEAPSLRKKAKGEKTAVFVFALRRNDAAIAKAPKAAVALATKWLSDAPNDPGLSGRLKGIFHASGDGVPNLAKKWNGKPVLLAASAGFGGRERPGISRFIRGADCLEVNVDVSESFTYIARGAIYLVTDKLRDIRIKFGFVVEGRERDELCRNQNLRRLLDGLPEALITAVDVHQFDWRACVDGLVQADTPSDDDEA